MAGAYPARLLETPFTIVARPAAGGDAPPAARGAIRLRHELAYSTHPVAGRAITVGKRTLVRGIHHVVQDGLDQAARGLEFTNARIDALQEQLAAEREHRIALERRLAELTGRLDQREPGP